MLSIAFPYLLNLLSQLQHVLGTSKGQMKRCTVFEDVRIIKPGSHVSSFSRVHTLGFVISPDHPKTPLIAKEMRAASVATCLVCFGEGREIGNLSKWQLTV